MQHHYKGISDVKSTWNDAQYIYKADLNGTPFRIWGFCEVKKYDQGKFYLNFSHLHVTYNVTD